MTEILVVEDSPDQAALVAALLDGAGYRARMAKSGAEALEQIASARPELVITDMVMAGMDGLELVGEIRDRYPDMPVILMTAFGSGEIAVEALRRGAAHYVPKARLSEDLIETVDSLLSLVRRARHTVQLIETLVEMRLRFVLPNDEDLIAGLVELLQDRICYRNPNCDENVLLQVGIAVQEAIRNAMHHGNLEVSSDLRRKSSAVYNAKVNERLETEAYAKRRVVVETRLRGSRFRCRVRDEGPGFDPKSVPNPTNPANLLKASGRGLYLISMFMDRVEHSESGSEIMMEKDLRPSGAHSA